MSSPADITDRLALAVSLSAWTREAMIVAGCDALGIPLHSRKRKDKDAQRRIEDIIDWVLNEHPALPVPTRRAMRDLLADAFRLLPFGLGRASLNRVVETNRRSQSKKWSLHGHPAVATVRQANLTPPLMLPTPTFAALDLPQLPTSRELADWLDVPLEQLDWLAGMPRYRTQGSIGSLVHYRFAWRMKASGKSRLIEAPKPRLKAIQHKILREMLDHVPVHPAAHGFVRGRSPLTAAKIHTSEPIVIALDLLNFFPSIPAGRIFSMFRHLGYPYAVARCLTGLTTTATPADVFEELPRDQRPDFRDRRVFLSSHLPQGAPTSPALANLCAYRLDLRLAGLAQSCALNYARYADDLSFSGEVKRSEKFVAAVTRIVANEGFDVHPAKTRVMAQAKAQRLLGMTVNVHLNIARTDYDALKALLFNCRRFGPHSQNRDGHPAFQAHLDGRIQWVEQVNPQRGARLRLLFDSINWGGATD